MNDNFNTSTSGNNSNSNLQNLYAENAIYIDFPKKYERNFIDSFDKRFVIIWLITFLVQFSTAYYFSTHPIADKVETTEITRIQQQFARLVLNKDLVKTVEKENITSAKSRNVDTDDVDAENLTAEAAQGKEDLSVSAEKGAPEPGRSSDSKQTAQAKGKNDSRFRSATRRSTNKYSAAVSSQGLLGLLTSSSENAKGEGVADILGKSANSQGNLKDVLTRVDNLQKERGTIDRASAPGQNRTLKGDRAVGDEDIDGLIAQREKATSTDISRQGKFVGGKVSAIKQKEGVVSGKRNQDDISAVVNQHNAAIQSCYQREVKRNPDLKGKLVVRFTISPEGKVKSVQLISSTLENDRVERCIISRIRRWDNFGAIDPSMGDTSFRQVYTFGY